MNKRIISGIAVAGVVAYFFANKDKRERSIKEIKKTVNNFTTNDAESFPIEEAGKPETDNPENANMVYEGSQFGVSYYNKVNNEE